MSTRKPVPVGALFMTLVVALAAMGVGYGLWSKTLFIQGSVSAGDLNTAFVSAFTDDDGKVDNALKDALDAGPDPSAPGPNPIRISGNLASCNASLAAENQDLDPEAGVQTVWLNIAQGYPSYWCTGWFDVSNTGTVPVALEAVQVPLGGSNVLIGRCEANAFTSLDLNGDNVADIEVCAIGLPATGKARIDPGALTPFQVGVATHLLDVAGNQGESFAYTVQLVMQQWTVVEPTSQPTIEPTGEPTGEPTLEPTLEPTSEPTAEPTVEPTSEPTLEPTPEPTLGV